MESLKEKLGATLIVVLFIIALLYGASTNKPDTVIIIAYSIMFVLLLLIIWTSDKMTRVNLWLERVTLSLTAILVIPLIRKYKQWQKQRQTMNMLRDDDDPNRVARRRKRAAAAGTIKAYAFFISTFIAFPLAVAGLGVWRMQSNAPQGKLLILLAVLCALQFWGTLLVAYLKGGDK